MPRTVYPRVCGGTPSRRVLRPDLRGLSPRVRGNPQCPAAQVIAVWSIPACAGEPAAVYPATSAARVYPRVCGGTSVVVYYSGFRQGLSPRVRGNLFAERYFAKRDRSIPACAGEPSGTDEERAAGEVYPRVCGGTSRLSPSATAVWGLSPRVRGNQRPGLPKSTNTRSIPACAGEPRIWFSAHCTPMVYPRVCGGTPDFASLDASKKGLSPRVRGNRRLVEQAGSLVRSIPACAGEPSGTA